MSAASLLEAAALVAGTLLLAGCQSTPTASEHAESKAAWVYHGGSFYWSGDYSSNAVPYYTDKTGEPAAGGRDIKVVLLGKWGLFQPYARNWDFDTKPYAYLTFSIKPTRPDQTLQLYFMQVGDKPVGVVTNPLKYGPPPEIGAWTTYKIPLEDLGVAGIHVYKFAIQDQTGSADNTFYLNDIGFIPAGR
jgi:hypothetical protein